MSKGEVKASSGAANKSTDRLLGRVAVFPPVGSLFDYALKQKIPLGSLVRVPLGRSGRKSLRYGVLVEYIKTSPHENKLKTVDCAVNAEAVLEADVLKLARWVADYYQGAVDRALFLALPTAVRRGLTIRAIDLWCMRDADEGDILQTLGRAPAQAEVVKVLRRHGVANKQILDAALTSWRPAMRALVEKGIVERHASLTGAMPNIAASVTTGADELPEMTADQKRAFQIVTPDGFGRYLLDGVTGSGKTMVYLHLVRRALRAGRQALVMTPEIGLASELLRQCRQYFGELRVAAYHSDMSSTERARIWAAARSGDLSVVVGTRSAVFMPFARLSLIVIDEEHDESYKEHVFLPYHARDVAIKRARDLDIAVVLGSATPAMETVWNVRAKRYRNYCLTKRYAGASLPPVEVIDTRNVPINVGLSPRLIGLLRECMARDEMALLFLNRRGYAPRMLCHACGAALECPQCDLPMVWHRATASLLCHHCDFRRPVPQVCDACGASDLRPLGQGTERIEEDMKRLFPDSPITRLDSDSARRRDARARRIREIMESGRGIVIGTQMISKGHHFPTVTLAGIINVDQYFLSTDFRALERLGQMVAQVSGRAGRGALAGRVALQTSYPRHPLLLKLLKHGYGAFADELLKERRTFAWPPFRALAVVRVAARRQGLALQCLEQLHARLRKHRLSKVDIYSPMPAMMEKIANYYRARLLVASTDRKALSQCLRVARAEMDDMAVARNARWQIDVDPLEIE